MLGEGIWSCKPGVVCVSAKLFVMVLRRIEETANCPQWNHQTVLRRFAETTNPPEDSAGICQNPGSWNSLCYEKHILCVFRYGIWDPRCESARFEIVSSDRTLPSPGYSSVRSAQVRAHDDRAQVLKHRNSLQKSLCPVVICHYLCSSDNGNCVCYNGFYGFV